MEFIDIAPGSALVGLMPEKKAVFIDGELSVEQLREVLRRLEVELPCMNQATNYSSFVNPQAKQGVWGTSRVQTEAYKAEQAAKNKKMRAWVDILNT